MIYTFGDYCIDTTRFELVQSAAKQYNAGFSQGFQEPREAWADDQDGFHPFSLATPRILKVWIDLAQRR